MAMSISKRAATGILDNAIAQEQPASTTGAPSGDSSSGGASDADGGFSDTAQDTAGGLTTDPNQRPYGGNGINTTIGDNIALPQPNFGDLKGSMNGGLAAQRQLTEMQHTYKTTSSKLKMQSALSKSLTTAMDEIARRLA